MAILPASKFTKSQLKQIFDNQKIMSEAQKLMAQEHPHLLWVEPPAEKHGKVAGGLK
jgi:hypothetical protein